MGENACEDISEHAYMIKDYDHLYNQSPARMVMWIQMFNAVLHMLNIKTLSKTILFYAIQSNLSFTHICLSTILLVTYLLIVCSGSCRRHNIHVQERCNHYGLQMTGVLGNLLYGVV